MADVLRRRRRTAVSGLDEGRHALAEFGIGDTDHRTVRDAGKRDQRGFDLGRVDVDAARDDHVAEAVADIEEAVRVEIADIARSKNAVDLERAPLFSILVIGEIRSEEHTSELQSLMRISYAVFC